MKKNLLNKPLFLSSLILFSGLFSLNVLAQPPVVVSTGCLNGWTLNMTPPATATFVNGPGTPPLGSGSAQFTVGPDGFNSSSARTTLYNGMLLADLTTLDYWTYVTNNNGGQASYIQLNIDFNNDGVTDDQIFFEPVYQNGTYIGDPVPNQCGGNPSCVALNTWQHWDAAIGGWWSFNEGAGGPPLHTLANYSAAHPGARLTAATSGSLRIVHGFGGPGSWGNFNGNADAITIGFTGMGTTTYDFEATCPPDSDNDGIPDSQDNCPNNANPNQEDSDNDGIGNACDNCPNSPNPGANGLNAYNGTDLSGNQQWPGRLGLTFTANQPVLITHLGAYDDDQDGLSMPIQVGIVRNSDGAIVVGPVTLSGGSDPLVALHRMKSIPAVLLPQGQYTVVAVGYGATESNGNVYAGDLPVAGNGGAGQLVFDKSMWDANTTIGLPTTNDVHPFAFHAGTFTYAQPGPGFPDNDNDGIGDPCDPDDDNDNVPDGQDNCQFISNPNQENNDGDALGDACDPDDDNDTIVDAEDNCPMVANTNQADEDGDGQGDVCDVTCGKKNDKARICHKGKEQCVSWNAVQAHLAHGDVLGPCPGNTNRGEITDIEDISEDYKLSVAPNPVRTTAAIKYELPLDSKVNIVLFDPSGKAISTLVNGERKAGEYIYQLDASKLPAGIYYYRMTAIAGDQQFVQGQKLMIIK